MSFNQEVTKCLPDNPLTFVFTLYKSELGNQAATLIRSMWLSFKSNLDQQANLCYEPKSEKNLDNIKNLNLFSSVFQTPDDQAEFFRQTVTAFLNQQKQDPTSPLLDFFVLDEQSERNDMLVSQQIDRMVASLKVFEEAQQAQIELKKESVDLQAQLERLQKQRQELLAQLNEVSAVTPEQQSTYEQRLHEINKRATEEQQELQETLRKTEQELVEIKQEIAARQQKLQEQLGQIDQKIQIALTEEKAKFTDFQQQQSAQANELTNELGQLDQQIQQLQQRLMDLGTPVKMDLPQPPTTTFTAQPVVTVEPLPTIQEQKQEEPLPVTTTVATSDAEQRLQSLLLESQDIKTGGGQSDIFSNSNLNGSAYNFLGQHLPNFYPTSQSYYQAGGGGTQELLAKATKNCRQIGDVLKELSNTQGGNWKTLSNQWDTNMKQPTNSMKQPTNSTNQPTTRRALPAAPTHRAPTRRALPAAPTRRALPTAPTHRAPTRRALPVKPKSPPPRKPSRRPPPPQRIPRRQ